MSAIAFLIWAGLICWTLLVLYIGVRMGRLIERSDA